MSANPTKYVLTVVGPDRPGIVEAISGILSENRFNIEDSRMAVLGGDFAMVLLVTGSGSLEPHLAELERRSGMTVHARTTSGAPTGGRGIPFEVRGYAMDHPGIVHALAREIAAFGANIEEMDTSTQPAPVTGTPLFDVRMRISLPPEVSVNQVRKRLTEIGEDQNIDVSMEPFTH